MNLYGFAGGDPINFSDPFGLCPACDVLDAIERTATTAGPGVTIVTGATAAFVGGPILVGAGAAVAGVTIADRMLSGRPAEMSLSTVAAADATSFDLRGGKKQREIPDNRRPHEKGTSPSTREKHEDTRNPSTDKKRQHDKWQQNPNKKPPG